jgi:hypothetical protein
MNGAQRKGGCPSGRILAVLAILGVACSSDDGPAPVDPGSGAPVIVTSLSLRSDTIPVGRFTEVRIALHNMGQERVVIPLPDGDLYGIRVSDTADAVAWMPCESDSIPGQLALDPGGVRVAVLTFSPIARPGFCYAADTLSAGAYTMRAGIHGYEDTYPWASATFTVIE